MGAATDLGKTGHLHTQLVYELTRAVAEAKHAEDIFEAALNCLGASLGTQRSAILLFGDDGRMHFRSCRGLSAEYQAAVDGHSPWDSGITDPQPVLVPDVRTDPELAALRPVIEGEGIRSLAFVPLLAGSKLLGKFMVYFDQPHEFEVAEVMVAQTIAAQVAFAVEQQASRAANEQLTALTNRMLDSIGIAVYATDAEGYITQYNEAAAEMWGRRPELGKEMWCGSWRIYSPEGTRIPHPECPMGIALREARPVRGVEILVEHPSGERHTVMPYPTPLRDANGKVIGAVNALVDITAQSHMRTALQEALRAKDDFLGQVSHELRTPLTQLIGNAHLLARRWETLDEQTRAESMQELMSHSQRMQRLVNNMLVLSRLERGIMPETEPHLLQRLLKLTIDEFCMRFPGTELIVDIAPGLPPVPTNPDTIDQVAWNLLTNARKYGPPEGPVTVRAEQVDCWTEVRVLDRGPGVAAEDLNRLFEPYFRSAATSAHASGLGLGLSVCKTLIETQGGRIWAKRLSPTGMEFGFALPALGDGE